MSPRWPKSLQFTEWDDSYTDAAWWENKKIALLSTRLKQPFSWFKFTCTYYSFYVSLSTSSWEDYYRNNIPTSNRIQLPSGKNSEQMKNNLLCNVKAPFTITLSKIKKSATPSSRQRFSQQKSPKNPNNQHQSSQEFPSTIVAPFPSALIIIPRFRYSASLLFPSAATFLARSKMQISLGALWALLPLSLSFPLSLYLCTRRRGRSNCFHRDRKEARGVRSPSLMPSRGEWGISSRSFAPSTSRQPLLLSPALLEEFPLLPVARTCLIACKASRLCIWLALRLRRFRFEDDYCEREDEAALGIAVGIKVEVSAYAEESSDVTVEVQAV